jgi:hypothetical protein
MKTKGDVTIELVQAMKGYQKNLTRLLENPMWKKPRLLVEKKGKSSKSRKVDEAKSSPHDGGLEKSQVDLHASSHVEAVLAPNYDEDSSPYPIYDTYEDTCMIVPKYDEGWVFEKLFWDMDPSSQEPCMEDDKG